MQGDTQVIDALNRLLMNELTAMDQYFIHSRMYEDWGFNKLYERIDHEFDDEKQHASMLIQRILFLEGTPDLSKREPLRVGKDVPSMLENDLKVEYEVDQLLKETMALCESKSDFVTRQMLQTLIDETEMDHAYWLEQQLGLIDKMGLENYLQTQI
ncbi:bacterioferritin [Aliagarivorans marinus]|uniref:bacterioferritin n=1 Tax=Aliagarivorans marinus TaxID=561965 RepID=UPI0003FB75D8|nr:bacterioferritin [Aliagarivorans marinus]